MLRAHPFLREARAWCSEVGEINEHLDRVFKQVMSRISSSPSPVAPTSPAQRATSNGGLPSTVRGLTANVRRTPGTLLVALGAIWLLTLVVYLIARNGLNDARTSAQTIDRADEPNVVNARLIASSLTDMHAHVANAFLVGFGEYSADWNVYERQRETVASTLALVQQNNVAPDAIDTSRQLALDFGVYQDRIARAAENQAQNFPVGLSYFREANDLIQQKLLPAADRLAQSGDSALEETYASRVSGVQTAASGVIIAGFLLLATLTATQVFLMWRTHRMFNPPLICATLLAIVLAVRTASALEATSERLTEGRDGPYASLFDLTRARVLGYSANTDKSLWLLSQQDPPYQTSFNLTTPQVEGLLNDAVNSLPAAQRQTGQAALMDWANYTAIDMQLRAQERAGDHASAVRNAVGTAPTESDGALATFDQTIGQLIDANQADFDARTQQVLDDLGGPVGAETLLPVSAVLIAALAWLGLQPRISEYR